MQRLEVSGAVRPLYGSLGVEELKREQRKSAARQLEQSLASRPIAHRIAWHSRTIIFSHSSLSFSQSLMPV